MGTLGSAKKNIVHLGTTLYWETGYHLLGPDAHSLPGGFHHGGLLM